MTTGSINTFLGYRAGQETTQLQATHNGIFCWKKNSNKNTFIGTVAGLSHQMGDDNVAIGHAALSADSTGVRNNAIGSISMSFNSSGSRNTALGFGTLNQLRTGNNNVAIGLNSKWPGSNLRLYFYNISAIVNLKLPTILSSLYNSPALGSK